MKQRRSIAWLLVLALLITLTPFSLGNLRVNAATSVIRKETVETQSSLTASGEALTTAKTLYTITEEDLEGIEWQGASKVKVYVKMTEGGDYSVVNAMVKLGPNGVGKASSKYLVGQNPLVSKSGNAIQDNLIGLAGTGNYVFPDVNLNKSMQDGSTWDDSYASYITITVNAWTTKTDCELLGLVFSNGAKYPADFTVPTVESGSYDVITEDPEEVTYRDKLQYAVDFVSHMDENAYEAESWTAFMAVVDEARELLADASAGDSKCETLHGKLESVKANMRYVMSDAAADPLPFRSLTGDELVYEMGLGTNLGNTLDGHSGFTPSETAWQSAITTKEYMQALHDAGYNTVRIPVTWGNMISGDLTSGYTINENWLNRVQEIVDYCVSQDMYAIINIHHDGAEQTGWLLVASDEIDTVYYQFAEVWRIIAERFKDYDEHLIFESMNEITCMEGNDKNSADAIAYDTPIIMNLNQIFVNVVRSTGSNNTTRWLAAVAHYANNGSNVAFSLPTDSYNENSGLMFAAHIYKASTNVTWTYSEVYEVVDGLKRMANKFNVPMYLGEWGNRIYKQSDTETGYNDVARAYFCEIVTRACQVAGVVPCVWDQGYGNNGEYETGLFSFWNRTECRPIFANIIEAMVRGTYLKPTEKNLKYDFTDIVTDPEIVPITSVELENDEITMILGDTETVVPGYAPEDSNDVLLWSTDDDTVATVTRGIIRARGIGITTVHVYSQSGSVEKKIKVIVKAASTEIPATKIETDAQTYSVVVGKNLQITTTLAPENCTDTVSYVSSNTEVATVNALGKVTAISEGTAYITITASNGLTKTVKVVVGNGVNTDSIQLALHVLFNDSAHNYWGCELSVPITVTGDGEYSLRFDLATEISAAAQKAGITELANLTAIYIKDYDVTKGNATSSPIQSAYIVYTGVEINGVPMTITDNNSYQCIQSGVFDSGKPINAWDGSVISNVSVTDHSATFTGISNPTSFKVTFTLSNVVFQQSESDETIEAEKLTTTDDKNITLEKVGDTKDLTVSVTPATANTKVIFVSSDTSVAVVDTTGVTLDENGAAKITVTAVGEGKATITVMTDNGLTLTYKITVGDTAEPEPEDPTPENPDDGNLPEKPENPENPEDGAGDAPEDTGDHSVLIFAAVAAVLSALLAVAVIIKKKAFIAE